jgi:hypothetical protein
MAIAVGSSFYLSTREIIVDMSWHCYQRMSQKNLTGYTSSSHYVSTSDAVSILQRKTASELHILNHTSRPYGKIPTLLVPLTMSTIKREDGDLVKEADFEFTVSIEEYVGVGEAKLSVVLPVCKGKLALLLMDDSIVQLPDWHPMPQNAVSFPHAPEELQQSPHFPAQSRLPYWGPQVPSVL